MSKKTACKIADGRKFSLITGVVSNLMKHLLRGGGWFVLFVAIVRIYAVQEAFLPWNPHICEQAGVTTPVWIKKPHFRKQQTLQAPLRACFIQHKQGLDVNTTYQSD